MQIIYQGAESVIYLDTFENEKVLVKERISKKYRLKQIDEKIRKERTRGETKLLSEARKCGVPTPKIISIDEKNAKIIMEFVDGVRVKEFLYKAGKNHVKKICFEIGRLVGKLHTNNIIHGDLTTSNMILKNDKIYFIDFGLGNFSKRIEDQGIDMNLLQEALKSTHYKILNLCWENIVKGYKKEYSKAEEALKRVDEIEKRARYVER